MPKRSTYPENPNRYKYYVGCILAVALGMILGLGWRRSHLPEPAPVPQRFDLTEVNGISTHQELVMVYVGATGCEASNRPEMEDHLATIRAGLAKHAAAIDSRFVAVGIALNWDVAEGLAHLSASGHFDEVNAGQNALNSGALRYIWDTHPGPAATPQVMLLHRTLSVNSAGVTSIEEDLLVRRVGLAEIGTWVARGLPTPITE